MNNGFELIIAGGKTGGHLFPGIAVAQAVQRLNKDARVLFVGTDSPFEIQTLADYGYPHRPIYSKPVKGGNLFKQLFSVSIILVSLAQSLAILIKNRPDFVLGVGGFSSFAVVLAAWILRIPTAIQEQNAVPGMTNRMLSRFAQTIFTAFESTQEFEQNPKTRYVGNPVRKPHQKPLQKPMQKADRKSTRAETTKPTTSNHRHPDRFTLLITGGSQGAASINTAVMDAFKTMKTVCNLQVIHQTGARDLKKIRATYRELGIPAIAKAFFTDMPRLQKNADLIISRAGAGTLSELSLLGKPAILIPFPHAADDHQTVNAASVVKKGGALMIPDHDLNGERLKTLLNELTDDPARLERMGKAMKSMAMPDADKKIAAHILNNQPGKKGRGKE